MSWKLELTPVDFTAELIVSAATQKFSLCVGKVYHLTADEGEMPDWKDVCGWMRKAGYGLRTLNYDVWIDKWAPTRNIVISLL